MIFDKHINLKYKYGNRHFWCEDIMLGQWEDTEAR